MGKDVVGGGRGLDDLDLGDAGVSRRRDGLHLASDRRRVPFDLVLGDRGAVDDARFGELEAQGGAARNSQGCRVGGARLAPGQVVRHVAPVTDVAWRVVRGSPDVVADAGREARKLVAHRVATALLLPNKDPGLSACEAGVVRQQESRVAGTLDELVLLVREINSPRNALPAVVTGHLEPS